MFTRRNIQSFLCLLSEIHSCRYICNKKYTVAGIFTFGIHADVEDKHIRQTYSKGC